MILVLKPGIDADELAEVMAELEKRGIEGRLLKNGPKPLVHLVSGPTRSARKLLKLEQVEALVPTSGPRVRESGRRFYPYHFVHLAAVCLLLAGVLVLLAGSYPPGLGDAIDAQHPPAEVPYSWFVRAPLAFVALFPHSSAWLGWVCLYALLLGALLLPALERSAGSAPARWPKLVGVLVLVGWLYMTFGGAAR
jgi:quinol-cytochrome oxidoreductase complex cytochrome b subunit